MKAPVHRVQPSFEGWAEDMFLHVPPTPTSSRVVHVSPHASWFRHATNDFETEGTWAGRVITSWRVPGAMVASAPQQERPKTYLASFGVRDDFGRKANFRCSYPPAYRRAPKELAPQLRRKLRSPPMMRTAPSSQERHQSAENVLGPSASPRPPPGPPARPVRRNHRAAPPSDEPAASIWSPSPRPAARPVRRNPMFVDMPCTPGRVDQFGRLTDSAALPRAWGG